MNDTKGLKFAGLVRVSSERSAKRALSFYTQSEAIEHSIKMLGGKLYKWYRGQEKATPKQEREILDELLQEAAEKKFDAVMVYDDSRWTRDVEKNMRDIGLLRDNQRRYFVQTREVDLMNPQQVYLQTNFAAIAEMNAKDQLIKATQSRITQIKRGIPHINELPWGRTYDRKAKQYLTPEENYINWDIDPVKHKKILDAVELYLEGENGLNTVAPKVGMCDSSLNNVFVRWLGDTWHQKVEAKLVGLKYSQDNKIPPLIDDPETIKRVHQKMKHMQHYGKRKHEFLLQGLIFCAKCGKPMHGATRTGENAFRNYRHSIVDDKCFTAWNATELEALVWKAIGKRGRSNVLLQEALEAAAPKTKEVTKLQNTIKRNTRRIGQIKKEMNNLAKTIAKADNVTAALINSMNEKAIKLEEERDQLHADNEKIEKRLEFVPEHDEGERIRAEFEKLAANPVTFEEKRKVIRFWMEGFNELYEKPCGVYVDIEQNMKRPRLPGSLKGIEIIGNFRRKLRTKAVQKRLKDSGGGALKVKKPRPGLQVWP